MKAPPQPTGLRGMRMRQYRRNFHRANAKAIAATADKVLAVRTAEARKATRMMLVRNIALVACAIVGAASAFIRWVL